jgi:hypothetical protein
MMMKMLVMIMMVMTTTFTENTSYRDDIPASLPMDRSYS